MMKSKKHLFVSSLVGGLLSVVLVSMLDAATITVPDDNPSIKDAIDGAAPGDTIEVKAGTYVEPTINISKSITLRGAGSDQVTIEHTGTGGSITRGIEVSGTADVTLEGFTFKGSPGFGIKLETSDDLIVQDVVAMDNGRTGIDVNQVNRALFVDVASYGNGGAGIALRASSEICVENAATSNNAWGGLALWAIVPEKLIDVKVTDSTFSGEEACGVFVQHGGEFDVRLTGNHIENNGCGIFIEGDDTGRDQANATGIEFLFNDISGNDIGVLNNGIGELEASGNYWGHASGPGGPDGRTNPAGKTVGKGDAISGLVNWDPWLKKSISHPSRR